MNSVNVAVPKSIKANRSYGMSSYLRSIWAVFIKDVKCEMRTRHALGAILLFALTSVVAVSYTLGSWSSKSYIAAPLIWLIVYFSAMSGLGRSFAREEETGTANLMRLAVSPNCVLIGKLIFNFITLLIIGLVSVPLFIILSGCFINNLNLFILVFVLGCLGLSSSATMTSAMVSRTSIKGALFAVISFPLILPVLALAIFATGLAMDVSSVNKAFWSIRLISYYCGAVIAASLIMFRFIWEN